MPNRRTSRQDSAPRLAKEITLRQFRYFAAAAETGQFSMAATAQHVSQSAITNAVLVLEQQLGVRLFDRLPHGVTLTAEGHRLYRRAREILDAVEDTLREPRFQAHNLRGKVRLAASYTVLGYLLPGLLARFRTNYPDIDFDLHDMDREGIEQGVLSGDIELGICLLSNIEKLQRFAHHTLIRSRRQLWASPSHPLLALPRLTLKDIAAHPYILITVDESERATMRYWRGRRLAPSVAFRTSSMEALRGLVAHGFGVTVLSDMVYRPWSLEGRQIEARPIADGVPDMEVGLLWQPGRTLDKPADALREFLIHASGS